MGDKAHDVSIRQYRTADASYVSYMQMRFYHTCYQFKPIFEYYLLKGMAEFLLENEGSMLWVAEDGELVVGAIAIVRVGDGAAQLRWFVLEQAYHGKGIGKKLMEQAMEFCRVMGYVRVFLWTVDFLHTARHLYERHGFRLKETKPNDEWLDRTINEELWEKTS